MRRRFTLFGFGFALGLLLLFFILNGKNASCNFFPNARMLEILRNKPKVFDPQVNEMMLARNIDSVKILELLHKGKIDFSKSKTRQEPCRYYWIDGYLLEKPASIYVENCDSLVSIEKIYLSE